MHLSILYEYQQFFQHRICFSIQPQLQLVNLYRNRRYFVIKLHTWFCLSYFLKTNIENVIAFINILWVSTVFSTPYLFLDTAARLQWPVTQIRRISTYIHSYVPTFNRHRRTTTRLAQCKHLLHLYKCGHRNVLSKRQVWMSIFHIINFIKKKKMDTGVLDFF